MNVRKLVDYGTMYPREPLNKSPTADDGSFPPILRFEKREIHTVFPRFSSLVLTKISRRPQPLI